MNKRLFLKKGSGLLVGGALASLYSFTGCGSNKENTVNESLRMIDESPGSRTNWAGNLSYNAKDFQEPTSIEELQSLVRATNKVRVLGTKHCFNRIADSDFSQISVRAFSNKLQVDSVNMKATINSGASYGQICTELHNQGFALHNLASLPHISVAGAMATATHGSGVANGNLGSAVSGFEFIDSDGSLHKLSHEQDGEGFQTLITHLGALGIITSITLDLQPAFDVVQRVYQELPVRILLENFLAVMSGGYSVSLFTDYQSDTVNQVWVKSRADSTGEVDPDDYYGARAATRNLHPISAMSAENCTEQMGVSGPWYERLPHFRMDFTPSSGKELQSEFFVPIEHASEAFEVIAALKKQLKPVLMISEVRTIAGDNQWMSPFYHQDSVAFHFTWEQSQAGVEAVLPLIQDGLERFGVRPHWGKVFTINPQRMRSLYPNLDKFKQVVTRYDPNRKFINKFLEKLLYS
ncbi:MAG: putative xylitol oxidase [Cyclobacteriaceae bacterium]|nr:MAG: putative xylitol oxidase [Cyclobacteriaceae bacterium]